MENLTTQLEIKYVYSAEVLEQKYRYNMTAKDPNLKLDENYKQVYYAHCYDQCLVLNRV